MRTIVGVIDDKGLLKGLIKFAGAGGGTSLLDEFAGIEKSSISLFSKIPVLSD